MTSRRWFLRSLLAVPLAPLLPAPVPNRIRDRMAELKRKIWVRCQPLSPWAVGGRRFGKTTLGMRAAKEHMDLYRKGTHDGRER